MAARPASTQTDALAGQPFLVVTDITGAAATGRIRAAAALDRADLEALFAHRILSETLLAFDEPLGQRPRPPHPPARRPPPRR